MIIFLISTLLLTITLFAYFRVATHFGITDKPNVRSSHTVVTIRGGGIIFPVAALLWFVISGFEHPWFIVGLTLMAVISFLDDVMELSPVIRILFHFAAVTLLFLQAHVFGLPWPYVFAAYILTIGWINAFNFMDGINGITAFYALTALGTFFLLNRSVSFAPEELTVLMIISVLVFSFFNVRKQARCFAGDVGSIPMAFLLSYFMISLILKTGRWEYILLFSVYGADAIFTILDRLRRRENIFKAHRSHLYQYLANEMGWNHLVISAIYSLAQLSINVAVVLVISRHVMNTGIFCGFMVVISGIYLVIRILVRRKIQLLQG